MTEMTESNGHTPIYVELDATGLHCPQPVLMARKALAELQVNERLILLADDPHAEIDVEVFCQRTGNRLIRVDIDGDTLRFEIQPREPETSP